MKIPIRLSRSTQIFIGLTLLYAAMTFLLPANKATMAEYNITSLQYHYLLLTVRIPIIGLWAVAFYSYRWLVRYARQVADTAEGPYFASIAKGMGWIAWGFPIPALISTVLNSIANSRPGFLSLALIIGGYTYVIVPLVAFTYISTGAHALSQYAKVQLTTKHIRLLIFGLVTFSVLFCLLIADKLHGANLTDSFNAYYLPNWLVWLTIVVPYLYAAFVGIFAALELILVARRTPGVIYKQGLEMLAVGLVLIIVMLVSLQYFRSIIPRSGHLTIGSALILTYGVYALASVGSLLLAAGAKRLKRIEDA